MDVESGCASQTDAGYQEMRGSVGFVTIYLLVTDNGKNYLTFVSVTEDFVIMDLENQSEEGTLIVAELHGGCRSHPQPSRNVRTSRWRDGWGGWGDEALQLLSLPQEPSLRVSVQLGFQSRWL